MMRVIETVVSRKQYTREKPLNSINVKKLVVRRYIYSPEIENDVHMNRFEIESKD